MKKTEEVKDKINNLVENHKEDRFKVVVGTDERLDFLIDFLAEFEMGINA